MFDHGASHGTSSSWVGSWGQWGLKSISKVKVPKDIGKTPPSYELVYKKKLATGHLPIYLRTIYNIIYIYIYTCVGVCVCVFEYIDVW